MGVWISAGEGAILREFPAHWKALGLHAPECIIQPSTMHNLYDVFPSKEMPHGREDEIITPLGDQKSQTLQFRGEGREYFYNGFDIVRVWLENTYSVNWRFLAKRVQYKNRHIIESSKLLHRLQPSFLCTAIKTAEYCSWVVRTRIQQIQDGGLPPFLRNR